jgi:hypothetical protein
MFVFMMDRANGALQEAKPAPEWKWGSKLVEGSGRKIPRGINLKELRDADPTGDADWLTPYCQEMAS